MGIALSVLLLLFVRLQGGLVKVPVVLHLGALKVPARDFVGVPADFLGWFLLR